MGSDSLRLSRTQCRQAAAAEKCFSRTLEKHHWVYDFALPIPQQKLQLKVMMQPKISPDVGFVVPSPQILSSIFSVTIGLHAGVH